MAILIYDSNGELLKHIHQWDSDRLLTFRADDSDMPHVDVVHVGLAGHPNATEAVPMAADGDDITITLPGWQFTRTAQPLAIYFYEDMGGGEMRTIYETTLAVLRRNKPIPYSDAEYARQQAEQERIANEEQRIANELERIANENARKAAEIAREAVKAEMEESIIEVANAAQSANTAAQNADIAATAANEAAQAALEAAENVQDAINAANAAAENANTAAQAANENAIVAETAADNADAKAALAEQVASAASAAATNAEAATVAANSAAQSAIDAADTANGAAVRANAAAAATETIGSLVVDAPYKELSYSQGSINTTTGATNSTARGAVRTGAIPLGEFGFSVEMPDTYTVSVFYYQGAEYLGYDEPAQISEISGGRGDTIRLVVRLAAGGNLAPVDVSGISLSVRAVTDTTLTLPSKSADAYATGARFSSLESSILTISPTLTTWTQGGVDGSGQTTTNNTRIRTAFVDGTNAEYDIAAAEGYKFWVWYYRDRDLSTAVSKTDTVMNLRTQRGYWFVVIALKGSNSSVIRPAESTNITINQRMARTLRDWNGLHVSMMGDSISSYQGLAPAGNAIYYPTNDASVSAVQMWWWVALNELGALPLIMDGWSGSCVTDGVRLDRRPMSDPRRCQQLHAYTLGSVDDYDLIVTEENIGTLRTSPFAEYTPTVGDYAKRVNPDIILMTGGGNDYSYNAPIGSWDGHTDLDTTDLSHFREAYANTLNRIRAEYPDALIVCFKPWFLIRPELTILGQEQVNRNNLGLTYKDYCDAIEEIAELMACPVVDGFNEGFNRYNYYPTFCADNADKPTHPNGLGQRVMGANIAAQLRSVCVGYVDWLKAQKNN